MTAARRLAAILAADVVGYSRLMGEDEAGTARAVRGGRFPPFLNDRSTSIPAVAWQRLSTSFSVQVGSE